MPMTVLGSVLGAVRERKEVEDILPHPLGAYNPAGDARFTYPKIYKTEYDQGLKCILWYPAHSRRFIKYSLNGSGKIMEIVKKKDQVQTGV